MDQTLYIVENENTKLMGTNKDKTSTVCLRLEANFFVLAYN